MYCLAFILFLSCVYACINEYNEINIQANNHISTVELTHSKFKLILNLSTHLEIQLIHCKNVQ